MHFVLQEGHSQIEATNKIKTGNETSTFPLLTRVCFLVTSFREASKVLDKSYLLMCKSSFYSIATSV